MKTPLLLLTLTLCLPLHALCQDGIGNVYGDWLRRPVPPPVDTSFHLHFSYSGTGIVNNANDIKSYILSNALKFGVAKKDVAVNLTGSWVYGKQSHIETNNDFTTSLDVGLYKTLEHFSYWGVGTYTSSFSLQINEQEQTGLGVGYNIIDHKTATLVLSDGLLYEKDDLYDSLYGGPEGSIYQRDRYETVRNSFRVLYHWVIKKTISLDGTEFLQSSLLDSKDYILKLSASISVKLNKWLNVTGAAQYNQFTRTRAKNDIVTFGLTIVK